MASITELRRAVEAVLADIDGDVLVFPGKADYGARAGALDRVRLTVRVLVGPEHDETGRERLDDMLAADGPSSIKALLDADDTLGDRVADARAVSATGYRTYPTSDAPQLGCEWTVELTP